MSIWKVIIFILLTASILYTLHTLRKFQSWEFLYTIDRIDDVGTLSIVKDIRGTEPYMTFKMRCYFKDNKRHGNNWQALMDDTKCHTSIFDKCFKNRTLEGRQETHVLRFIMENNVRRCACTDIKGWCHTECQGFTGMKCCLDRGKSSVLCRK